MRAAVVEALGDRVLRVRKATLELVESRVPGGSAFLNALKGREGLEEEAESRRPSTRVMESRAGGSNGSGPSGRTRRTANRRGETLHHRGGDAGTGRCSSSSRKGEIYYLNDLVQPFKSGAVEIGMQAVVEAIGLADADLNIREFVQVFKRGQVAMQYHVARAGNVGSSQLIPGIGASIRT